MRKIKVGFAALIILCAILGCSVRHSVLTSATSSLSKSLKNEVPTVHSVQFHFTRPEFTISVKTSEALSEGVRDSILERVKQFTTINHMNEVARSVKWKSPISNVNLVIYNDSKSEPAAVYSTSYFKTFDASDTSEENIDGYVTWRKHEEPV
ncbi:hypothetical protein [Cohnella lupini]|uniref:Uncharacterized protein n=1 Tax=Cohnella lupini TaxID=1294267 RepID=A0A3D9IBE8_9BACL|nr:hypothetical protein [Cohnella lupini]RED58526.1 hypothetical protein DFP95_10850 [Cohnella lupini]